MRREASTGTFDAISLGEPAEEVTGYLEIHCCGFFIKSSIDNDVASEYFDASSNDGYSSPIILNVSDSAHRTYSLNVQVPFVLVFAQLLVLIPFASEVLLRRRRRRPDFLVVFVAIVAIIGHFE